MIVKRSPGCTENQGSWPRADQQHVASLFLQESKNIECKITRHCSSDLPPGGLEVPCTLRFSGDAKVRKILQT